MFFIKISSCTNIKYISQSHFFPFSFESWQSFLSGEEFLHGAFLYCLLFGNELVKIRNKSIHFHQSRRNAALLGERGKGNLDGT